MESASTHEVRGHVPTENTDTDAGKGVSSLLCVQVTIMLEVGTARWGYTSRRMLSLPNTSEGMRTTYVIILWNRARKVHIRSLFSFHVHVQGEGTCQQQTIMIPMTAKVCLHLLVCTCHHHIGSCRITYEPTELVGVTGDPDQWRSKISISGQNTFYHIPSNECEGFQRCSGRHGYHTPQPIKCGVSTSKYIRGIISQPP